MKTISKLIFLFVISTSHSFSEGGCGGHGGDSYSLEFYRAGKFLANTFLSWEKKDFSKISNNFNPTRFSNTVEKTRIVSVKEELEYKGEIVDAINYSQEKIPYIKINRARWDRHSMNRVKRLGIVLHEYLGIMKGIYGEGEWDHYEISTQLIDLYETKQQNLNNDIKKQVQQARELFKVSSAPSTDFLRENHSWSCLELSALHDDQSYYVHKNAFVITQTSRETGNSGSWHTGIPFINEQNHFSRKWTDIDPTESVDQKGSSIIEYLRVTATGDLIAEITTDYKYKNQPVSVIDSKRGVLSYFNCSRLGSKTTQMLNFMKDSLSPILKITETKDFNEYIETHKKIQESSVYKRCMDSNSNKHCKKVYKNLSKIELDVETQAVNNAKYNIEQINNWLNSLSVKENKIALNYLNELFGFYAQRQSYLKELMDLDDFLEVTNIYHADYLKNFVETMSSALPSSYKEALELLSSKQEQLVYKVIKEFKVND